MPKKPVPQEPALRGIPALIAYCRQITLFQTIAFLMGAVSTLAPAYVIVRSVAANAADTYIQGQLKKNGLDSVAIGQAIKDLEAQRELTNQLRLENLATQSDLSSLKAQNRQNQELLEKLLELQLRQ